MSQIEEEIAALIFGAVIVVLFSYERFNQTTYKSGTRLERLVTLLSPEKLRARKVVMRVWTYYCVGLLVLYATLCVYSEVLQSVIGIDVETNTGGAEGPKEKSIGIPPSVSLAIALILTGLAPSVPVLKRFEEWGRMTAHRIAGIPTRVLNDTDILRRKAINLRKQPTDSLLIPKGDWERRAFYRAAAVDQVSDPEDFGRDIDLIVAVSPWILERRLQLGNPDFRENFEVIEEELRKRKEILILELDERSGFVMGGRARPQPAFSEAPADFDTADLADTSELKRKSWDKVASDVDKLAEDMCILLALYVEHGIVPNIDLDTAQSMNDASSGEKAIGSEESAAYSLAASAGDKESVGVSQHKFVRQHDIAAEKLCNFLAEIREDAVSPEQLPSFGMRAFLWTASVVMIVTIAWSLGPGHLELGLRVSQEYVPWAERVSRYAIIATNGFIVPLAIFLMLRDGAKQAKRWRNPWRVHWTTWLPQMAAGLFLTWAICMLILIAVSLWMSAFDDIQKNANNWDSVVAVFEREFLIVFRGCILGLIVVLLLDGRIAGIRSLTRSPTWLSSLQWAIISALIIASFGGLARLTQSLATIRRWGGELDAIDRGLLFYATVYSALIGFFVIYLLSEVLLNQKQARQRGGASLFPNPAE